MYIQEEDIPPADSQKRSPIPRSPFPVPRIREKRKSTVNYYCYYPYYIVLTQNLLTNTITCYILYLMRTYVHSITLNYGCDIGLVK